MGGAGWPASRGEGVDPPAALHPRKARAPRPDPRGHVAVLHTSASRRARNRAVTRPSALPCSPPRCSRAHPLLIASLSATANRSGTSRLAWRPPRTPGVRRTPRGRSRQWCCTPSSTRGFSRSSTGKASSRISEMRSVATASWPSSWRRRGLRRGEGTRGGSVPRVMGRAACWPPRIPIGGADA